VNARESVSHEQAVELLPWLVNDTLDTGEKESVLEHALACVICRRELDELERVSHSVADTANPTPVPAPDMRNINARIDRLIDRQNRVREWFSWIRDTITGPWRVALVVQMGLIVVLASVLIWPGSGDQEFTTLTQPQNIPDGHYVRVVFSPDLAASELSELLDEMALTVADGPSARGVYTLGISESMSEDERARLLANLQRDPSVLFAQAVVFGTHQ
jgi:hypothetical protein